MIHSWYDFIKVFKRSSGRSLHFFFFNQMSLQRSQRFLREVDFIFNSLHEELNDTKWECGSRHGNQIHFKDKINFCQIRKSLSKLSSARHARFALSSPRQTSTVVNVNYSWPHFLKTPPSKIDAGRKENQGRRAPFTFNCRRALTQRRGLWRGSGEWHISTEASPDAALLKDKAKIGISDGMKHRFKERI